MPSASSCSSSSGRIKRRSSIELGIGEEILTGDAVDMIPSSAEVTYLNPGTCINCGRSQEREQQGQIQMGNIIIILERFFRGKCH